jgi:uncharacterized protein YukE
MNLRLPVLILLLLSFPLVAHAQSLGEVAREVRAEKVHSGAPHARVITNDDIEAPEADNTPSRESDASSVTTATPKDATVKKEGADAAKPAEGTKSEIEALPEPVKQKHLEAKKKDPEKEREERELETQKRSDEINKRYIERIAALHGQINTAQLLLTKLQTQQIDNTNEFKRTAAMSPTYSEYESQQREFNTQIEAQKSLITSLNSQLDEAREAARHAGVPHATDY